MRPGLKRQETVLLAEAVHAVRWTRGRPASGEGVELPQRVGQFDLAKAIGGFAVLGKAWAEPELEKLLEASQAHVGAGVLDFACLAGIRPAREQIFTLKAVKTAGPLMTHLEKKLQEISEKLSKATVDVVTLQEKQMVAKVAFQTGVGDLTLEDKNKATAAKD